MSNGTVFPPGRTDLILFPLEHISHQELLDKMLKDRDEVNQSINQLYLNTVNGSASWFSDMPCDNYNL